MDTADAFVVERIKRAGAIIHGRSTAPEFSAAGVTHSKLWGVTRNPWNTDFTPGGSSGGAAAQLAAGTTTLANGSDIGGSIRIPASCCGVVGFKPPYGRVPEEPGMNLDFYCHEGPLARTVSDCALFENVLAGPHPKDITTLKPKLRIPAGLKGIEGWKIAYSIDLGYCEVDPEVRYHEPSEAWAAGLTGLEIYERLIPQAAALLRPGRPLVLELGYGQDNAVAELLANDGRWDEPHIDPDFNDIPRVLTVRRARDS